MPDKLGCARAMFGVCVQAELDCYCVGSLDFNFLGNQGVFHYTPQKLNFLQGGSAATKRETHNTSDFDCSPDRQPRSKGTHRTCRAFGASRAQGASLCGARVRGGGQPVHLLLRRRVSLWLGQHLTHFPSSWRFMFVGNHFSRKQKVFRFLWQSTEEVRILHKDLVFSW